MWRSGGLRDRHRGRQQRRRQIGDGFGTKRIDPHRPRQVLDALLTPVLEWIGQLVSDLVVHDSRDADAARLGQSFQPCGDVNPVSKDVVFFDNYVAEVDANAEPDPPLLGHLRLAVDHPALDLGRTAHCVDDTAKFGEQAVAGVLHGPATVLFDLWVNELTEMSFEAFVRALLVRAHQPRITRYVGGEDRGKAASRGHGRGRPPGRKCDRLTIAQPRITTYARRTGVARVGPAGPQRRNGA